MFSSGPTVLYRVQIILLIHNQEEAIYAPTPVLGRDENLWQLQMDHQMNQEVYQSQNWHFRNVRAYGTVRKWHNAVC